LISYKEVLTIGTFVGRHEQDQGEEAASISGPHQAQFFLRLRDGAERSRTSIELSDEFRARFPKSDSIKFNFIDMGGMHGSMNMFGSKPVNIKVYGKDFVIIREICERIRDNIMEVKGLKDLEISLAKGRPEYHFYINRDKAIRYGLTAYQIENAIQTATLGQVATRYRSGGEEIDVRVILNNEFRNSLDEIKKIPVHIPAGNVLPLEQVCDLTNEQGPIIINRDNQYRLATVQGNITERDLNSIVKDVKSRISGISKTLPSGYFVEFGGEFEDMIESFKTLFKALAIAVLLVFMVMAAQFESLLHPFIVMFTMPLAVIGVVLGMLITGTTLSVVTLISVIILSGIVVNNGIVMIDYVNQLRKQGMSIREALIQGARTRLRPILVTAGTTIVGTIPMALSTGEGAEIRSPLAIALIGGLATSTLLTLFVLPIVYLWMDKISLKIKNTFKRRIQ
ncbi:MAG: efflux RND transporter permease subunit, partial [Elusimicrobiota bacterium]